MRPLLSFVNFAFVNLFSRSSVFKPNYPQRKYLFRDGEVPVIYDSSNILHRCLSYHAEQSKRISECVELLLAKRIASSGFNLYDVASKESNAAAISLQSTSAFITDTELEHARAMLVKTHSEEYVTNIETRCRNSREERIKQGRAALGWIGFIDGGDTYLTTESYDVCLRATAMWIKAVEHVIQSKNEISHGDLTGMNENALWKSSMVLSRPPGHHATKGLSNGFCLFNFCAASAIHALESLSSVAPSTSSKISILDWDVHYGQGTADIVKDFPNMRYVSIHQVPAFPFEGEMLEVSGLNNNILTIPIHGGTTWENGYQNLYEKTALPFLCSADWIPDLIIISAGYDGLESDELASVSLGAKDYGLMIDALAQHLKSSIPQEARFPGIVVGLEGGYQTSNKKNSLQLAVYETVNSLSKYVL